MFWSGFIPSLPLEIRRFILSSIKTKLARIEKYGHTLFPGHSHGFAYQDYEYGLNSYVDTEFSLIM